MGPKSDALRAMREKNYDERLERTRKSLRKAARDAFDHAMKKPARPARKSKHPFIPTDDTMIIPTGALGKPKRKARRHK